ncbi:unnamed protein product [Euphydryas editha]|uniref:Reverse transcriptase domain-containing protein n=1 Tax=Euphydryas editha TaxID=104508 RepID=A0AAU9UZV6_EUPED|nr:unnamed protein product [Euphydryas editha]
MHGFQSLVSKEENEISTNQKVQSSYAIAVKQNQAQLCSNNNHIKKDGRATKSASYGYENSNKTNEMVKGNVNSLNILESRKSDSISNTTENKDEREEHGIWAQINRKLNKYPHREVHKGGNLNVSAIKGTERMKYLHIWRLQKDTQIDNVEKHVRNICGQEVPIKVDKIKHKTERDYASFIVGIPESKYDMICRPESWAVNIEFYFFAITETGLNNSFKDAEIIPPGYSIIRSDRVDGRKQGGACLVATPRFELRRISCDVNIDERVFELVCAAVYLRDRFIFLLCVVYIPPNSSENEYMLLFKVIEQFCDKYREIIVLGDFNLYSCCINVNNYFEYFLKYCGFTQSNTIRNCNNRCLDLVLSTFAESGHVEVTAAAVPLVSVDIQHPPLEVTIGLQAEYSGASCMSDRSTQTSNDWNFYKADFYLLYSLLSEVDWSAIYDLDLDQSLHYFYNTINLIFDICVPRKTLNCKNSKYIYPQWYTLEIIREIKMKAILHKIYKSTKSTADYQAFSQSRRKVKAMIVTAYEQYRQQAQDNLLQDPSSFWNYVKSKNDRKGSLKIKKNGLYLNDAQCVQELAQYFHSVYSTERADLNVNAAVLSAGDNNSGARVHINKLELADVERALKHLKPKKSSGPDGIPPFIFKDCRLVLAEPLLYIYNKCLSAEVFPERWKTTRVIPVPKGESGMSVEGYRPVAVLSTPAKIFETAIYKSLYAQVNAQLSEAQHGFRPMRSTTSNLMGYVAHLLPTLDVGGQTDSAYFDFKKAFDLVDNDVLLRKLAGVGFSPHLLKFFASYMSDRQQYVEYAGHKSEQYFTRSGVSQGSNLGPLQFILMINDLPLVVKHAKCLLFADDLKLSLTINSVQDCERLQADIDRVVTWSKDNLLQFNNNKCSAITFSRAHKPLIYTYNIDEVPMTRVKEIKDLGVYFNTQLNFRDHIVNICKKAYKKLGFLLRTVRTFTNLKAITVLYNTLVRSQLECNATIWGPHEHKYILMLERIQNKFMRFLYLKYYGVYPFYPLMYPTLFVLGMVGYNELRVRRNLALALFVFKIIRGRLHEPNILEQIHLCVPDRYVWRRRRPRLFVVPIGKTELMKMAPLSRALCTINLVVENGLDLFCCSLSEFKKSTMYILSFRL